MSLSIFLALAASAVVMLWFVIQGVKKRPILVLPKLAIVSISLWTYVLVWISLVSYMGWPSYQQLPTDFRLHWAIVHEPHGEVGEIYIWVTPLQKQESVTDYLNYIRSNKYEPRAFRFGFDPKNKKHQEFYKQLLEALERIKNGETIIGRYRGLPLDGDNGGDKYEGLVPSDQLKFYKLPFPKHIRKNNE